MHYRLWITWVSIAGLVLSLVPIVTRAQVSAALSDSSSVVELNQQLADKKSALRALQDQIDAYQAKIRETRQKATTLANQISITDTSIDKTELSIQTKALEIDQLEIETELAKKEIEQEEDRIAETLKNINETLNLIFRDDSRSDIEALLTKSSFSDVFDQLHYNETLNARLGDRLSMLKSVRTNLEDNQKLLETKRAEADAAKEKLDSIKLSLEEERQYKSRLLGDTKDNESQFQKMLSELRAEQSGIDSEIVTLEKNLRDKVKFTENLQGGEVKLSWPVNPARGISAYFHDPDYPYRYVFEHPAIDIRTPQGTPIAAAASGYVARAKDGGMGYSYIMLVHSDGIATVYGHVSMIAVREGTYVTRGQIIGASGATPGTRGAGPLTTGPHLHFEVRLNGIPVDPLRYLP